jgi:hypothetical protein
MQQGENHYGLFVIGGCRGLMTVSETEITRVQREHFII